VWVDLSLLQPEPPKSGSGVLVTIAFNCTDQGQSALTLADALMRDPFGNVIPSTTNDGAIISTVPPIIGFVPLKSTVPFSTTFSVNVSIQGVPDLYSWKFNMSFDPSSVECLNVSEGTFLKQGGTTNFTSPSIDNTAGTIIGAECSLVGAGSGVSGMGALATVGFSSKSVDLSTLCLTGTRLYNSSSLEIPHQKINGTVDGVPTVTFRLLAVEKFFANDTGNYAMKSAQYLIQNLTRFRNWQNGTWGEYNYRSYIHLLSNATVALSLANCYRGRPTNSNILNEITTFLGATGSGESNELTVRIFYYNGHTDWIGWSGKYRCMDLGPDGGTIEDWQLGQALNTGDLATSNCTLVIMDTCYSGEYAQNLTRPGRDILTATHETVATGWLDSPPSPGYFGFFTGHQNTTYWNGTQFGPLGIIGGLFNAKDSNGDGWRSDGEVFTFAENTTELYAKAQKFNMVPDSQYGVAGGGIPLVMCSEYFRYYDILQGKTVQVERGFPHNGPPQNKIVTSVVPHDFSMFGVDVNRSRSSHVTGPWDDLVTWNNSRGHQIACSAAIADGIVFFGTLDLNASCNFDALDLVTGTAIWSWPFVGAIYSSPAVTDGMVFFGTLAVGQAPSGTLYALDEITGLVRWRFDVPAGAGIFSSPAVTDGLVFVGTMQEAGSPTCGVYAFNESTGEPVWFFATGMSVKSSPAVANGRVFVGSLDGTFYALNESSGQQFWTYPLSGKQIVSTPAADSDSVYVGTVWQGSPGGTVYAFNQFSGGSPKWQFAATSPFSSSPAVSVERNLVLIGSDAGQMYALNRTSGSSVWSRAIGSINMSSPTLSSDGLAYVGSTDGRLYCLNVSSGQVFWNCSVGGQILGSPALTDDHVVIGSMEGKSICCIGPAFPIQDLAVLSASATPSTVLRGDIINVTYTVANLGNVAETFNVSCLCNNTLVWQAPSYKDPTTLHVENFTLAPGTNATGVYSWNTTNAQPGPYTLMVQVNPTVLDYESDVTNNIFSAGTVNVGGIHDIAVTGVSYNKTSVGHGYPTNVTVTVINKGDFAENFNVTLYANSTVIGTVTNFMLAGGSTGTITFVWNTSTFSLSNYTINAYASPVPGETSTGDNILTGGIVAVTIPGDLNGDFKVNLQDLVILAKAYGIPPIRPLGNPNADIDGNGIVGLSDLVILAQHYGQHYP
jgi:outer membrane protein assembly factor BamB